MHARTVLAAAGVAALALAAPAPAPAFDALREALSRLPASAVEDGDGWLFGFVAPSTVRDWPLGDHPGAGDDGVNRAFVSPEEAFERTGIDFPALAAVLVFGAPPASVTFVEGPEIDDALVGATLLGRGLEQATEAGIPVYWRGEDFMLNLSARDPSDPFGGHLGVAQRIAVGPLGIVATRAWEPLRAALPLAAPDAPPDAAGAELGGLFAAMVDAAAVRDPTATGYAGAGFEHAAFAAPLRGGTEPPTGNLPPFRFAFQLAAFGEKEEAAQLVVAFDDRATAEAALPVLLARLQAFRAPEEGVPHFETSLAEHEGTGIAVVSMVFDRSEDAHPSSRALTIWRNAAFGRQFSVLATAE